MNLHNHCFNFIHTQWTTLTAPVGCCSRVTSLAFLIFPGTICAIIYLVGRICCSYHSAEANKAATVALQHLNVSTEKQPLVGASIELRKPASQPAEKSITHDEQKPAQNLPSSVADSARLPDQSNLQPVQPSVENAVVRNEQTPPLVLQSDAKPVVQPPKIGDEQPPSSSAAGRFIEPARLLAEGPPPVKTTLISNTSSQMTSAATGGPTLFRNQLIEPVVSVERPKPIRLSSAKKIERISQEVALTTLDRHPYLEELVLRNSLLLKLPDLTQAPLLHTLHLEGVQIPLESKQNVIQSLKAWVEKQGELRKNDRSKPPKPQPQLFLQGASIGGVNIDECSLALIALEEANGRHRHDSGDPVVYVDILHKTLDVKKQLVTPMTFEDTRAVVSKLIESISNSQKEHRELQALSAKTAPAQARIQQLAGQLENFSNGKKILLDLQTRIGEGSFPSTEERGLLLLKAQEELFTWCEKFGSHIEKLSLEGLSCSPYINRLIPLLPNLIKLNLSHCSLKVLPELGSSEIDRYVVLVGNHLLLQFPGTALKSGLSLPTGWIAEFSSF